MPVRVDLNADGSELPPEVETELAVLTEKRDVSIAHQIAFLESGLSIYRNEKALCEEFSITPEYLASAKERLRKEIDSHKENFKLGKYQIVQEIQGRVHLMTAVREAALRGDMESVKKFGAVLAVIEKYAPDRKLDHALKMLKDVNMETTVSAQTQTPGNININLSTSKGDELLAERRKKILDLPK